MKYLIIFIIICIYPNLSQAQPTDPDKYLENNRIDLRKDRIFLDKEFIGFTVIHGSEKAEDAELALIKAQLEKVDSLIYIPEVDVAMAFYFNEYLKNGDESLLKDLILTYKNYVPQEASVAMFNKWKELRVLAQHKYIYVYGPDYLTSYKYAIKYLMEMSDIDNETYSTLSEFWNNPLTEYYSGEETRLKQYLRTFISGYMNTPGITDNLMLDNLLENIADTFQEKTPNRDAVMYRNYMKVRKEFCTSKQFVRMGLFHLTKLSLTNMKPGFISLLIENTTYKPNDIYMVIGLLYNSNVVLDTQFDAKNKYKSYNETGDGYYTGQGFLPGVDILSENKLSDMTFFDITKDNSPFRQIKGLIYPGFELLDGSTWADYFDGAILIDSSEANKPIESIIDSFIVP